MIKLFGQNDPQIAEYAENVFKPQDEVLVEIRNRAKVSGLPDIHVGAMDGLHLEVLTRAFKVMKAVEIGTLAGYSGVNICRGLQKGGKLFTFEMLEKNAGVARESFRLAGFSDSVEIFIGPALENLDMIKSLGPFDLVFIDADKANYPHYLNWAAENLAVGGVVLADNTFAWGTIADEKFDSPQDEKQVKALDAFNRTLADHPAFRSTVIPTGEGLTLGVKTRTT